ncbi:hypothetical protein [Desulfobotulus sp.]|jgi:hypothetical protein|uniref:hypothetical protein n=1 Tax=Desulfobotulus sp. TaxID=1940337 RepID=UPI002A361E31|nr:hypothetical protein [Desulfobotulus sp.]MDY0164472.1 hypothetical protein [Desulfobotulus sp.]
METSFEKKQKDGKKQAERSQGSAQNRRYPLSNPWILLPFQALNPQHIKGCQSIGQAQSHGPERALPAPAQGVTSQTDSRPHP